MKRATQSKQSLLEPTIARRAALDAVVKLDPRRQIRNPVMFVVWVGAALTSVLAVQAIAGRGEAPWTFILAIALWLWFTLLFANFAEAVAEGRSEGQQLLEEAAPPEACLSTEVANAFDEYQRLAPARHDGRTSRRRASSADRAAGTAGRDGRPRAR